MARVSSTALFSTEMLRSAYLLKTVKDEKLFSTPLSLVSLMLSIMMPVPLNKNHFSSDTQLMIKNQPFCALRSILAVYHVNFFLCIWRESPEIKKKVSLIARYYCLVVYTIKYSKINYVFSPPTQFCAKKQVIKAIQSLHLQEIASCDMKNYYKHICKADTHVLFEQSKCCY